MSLVLIQLAKMTLIVLGIFFTPAITRKFVFQLTAPEASQMMKWGGVAMGGMAAIGAKSMGIARLGSHLGMAVAKRELPSASQEMTKVVRRIAESPSGKQSSLAQFSKKLVEGGNQRLQDWHLKNLHQKSVAKGQEVSKGIRGSDKMPVSAAGMFSESAKSLESFREINREKRDGISGKPVYPAEPKPGVLGSSIRLGDRAVSVAVQQSANMIKASTQVITQRASLSPASPQAGGASRYLNRGLDSSPRQSIQPKSSRSEKLEQHKPSQFHDRVQSAMGQNRKRLNEIFKGDKS